MYETMYAAPGVGLAAPQVAISKRILVIDVGLLEKDALGKETHTPDPKAIINPIVTIQEGKILWDEGCLSMPHLIVPVERSKKILVEGLDREGKKVKYLGRRPARSRLPARDRPPGRQAHLRQALPPEAGPL
jgi:peptide deformylase